MWLTSLNYVQHQDTPNEWRVEGLQFGPTNLLVGSNASGKTRVLNIILGLARILAGDRKVTFLSGTYDANFDDQGKLLKYELSVKDAKVTKEALYVNGENCLDRREGGIGRIKATKLNDMIEFQTPENELTAFARRDAIQHPFFQPLNDWARSLYHYPFGTPLGKDHLATIVEEVSGAPFDPRDPNQVIAIYRKGEQDFGDSFKHAIKRDMEEIDYAIDDIGAQPPTSIIVTKPSNVIALYVKETELGDVTDQINMSQGMFRAMSIIIQLNFSEMTGRPSCLLIDDIGEGLDFERSCKLIKLLMKKAEQSSVQLIMATNDRFVMNTVPLETWTVIRRVGQKINIYNYANSKAGFDEFKYTGLNNFEFFAFNFLEQEKSEK